MSRPLLAAVVLLGSGCFTARYLLQAAAGQASLIACSRPLSSVVKSPGTEPHVARLLSLVPDIKAFGEARGLKPTDNYARYTDLKRPAAVWVVQASPPLKLEPKRWSFPIAGTVPYLGFFDEGAARAYADQLSKDEGLDVDVRGAGAYSTLGWFKDPVLSTMLSDGPDAAGFLANTVLHESVHATVYVRGQSSFNESLASFVADRLTAVWLATRAGLSGKELDAYREAVAAGRRRVDRLHRAYEELDALYGSALGDAEKLARKAEVLERLRAELQARRAYNNATLVGYRTYDTGGPAFERLLERRGQDLSALLEAVKQLEPESFPEPQMEDFSPVIDAL